MDKNKAISGYEKIFDDGYRAGRASVVLPHPCDGPLYADWTYGQYADKIDDELNEVCDALADFESGKGTLDDLSGELTDVIIVCTSFLNALGIDCEARQELMRRKNESNSKRDNGMRFSDGIHPELVKFSANIFAGIPKVPERKPDKISHPAYYNHGIECIDYIQSHDFDFCLGNAIKYITRAGYKTDDPREDLRKAIQYLEFELERIEKEGGKNA